jgi:phage shock protein A
VHIYGLEDLDKAIAALDGAEQRGYRGGSREQAQLADGYRARAERRIRDADALHGLPQQRESLEQAVNDLHQAIELYQKAAGFGDAGASLKTARRRLDEVEARLDRLKGASLLERILNEVVRRDREPAR